MTLDELDRKSAELVMGWTVVDSYTKHDGGFYYMGGKPSKIKVYKEPVLQIEHWQPTRNIAQAWELLEKFLEKAPEVKYDEFQKKWHVVFWNVKSPGPPSSAEIAPEAIVRACLRAVGEDV